MDDSKSLNNWSKQLTINSVYIIDYGKKFPVTDKGSFSRKIAKLKYFNALNNISKLISGEINEIPEEEEDHEDQIKRIKKEILRFHSK